MNSIAQVAGKAFGEEKRLLKVDEAAGSFPDPPLTSVGPGKALNVPKSLSFPIKMITIICHQVVMIIS